MKTSNNFIVAVCYLLIAVYKKHYHQSMCWTHRYRLRNRFEGMVNSIYTTMAGYSNEQWRY